MSYFTVKSTSLWNNIDHVAVVSYNNAASVYQCAHFYENSSVILPNLSIFRRS